MTKRTLKSFSLVAGLGGALLVLSGCQTTVGVSYGYGAPYYDSMLWNDYYHRRDVDIDVDINRPERPNRPDRPVRPPDRPKPPIARPKPPRPPIHRPGGRPRLR